MVHTAKLTVKANVFMARTEYCFPLSYFALAVICIEQADFPFGRRLYPNAGCRRA
jgi:hypothetical protein